jgi:hypothetical protein
MRERDRLTATLLLSFSFALAAFACGKEAEQPEVQAKERSGQPPRAPARPPARPAPPLTAQEQTTMEKVMVARDEIAAIAEARARDCDAAAEEIEVVVDRIRPLLPASSAIERDPAKHAWIGEKYGARMLASSSKLMGLMENCDPHEGLSRIFESLE